MTHRRRRFPGLVRFVCIERYHERRPHIAGTARLTDGVLRPGMGIRLRPDPDGCTTWVLRCKCGINQQRSADELTRIAVELFAADPDASRVDVGISSLRGAVSGRGETWTEADRTPQPEPIRSAP